MNSINNKIIMRHVLEIRLAKRTFSFTDYKGELIDFFVKNLNGESIKISQNGSRIDIASKDLSKIFFVGYENFGLQIEGSCVFTDFLDSTEGFLKTLESFKKYNPDSIIRIGTRSLILFHLKGYNFENLKQKYKDIVFTNYKLMEEKTGATLSDIACTFELKRGGGVVNVLTGPVTKDEALQKVFKNKEHYEKFDKNNGLFIDIDFAKVFDKKSTNFTDLLIEIKDSISNIEDIFNGFVDYFNTDTDGK